MISWNPFKSFSKKKKEKYNYYQLEYEIAFADLNIYRSYFLCSFVHQQVITKNLLSLLSGNFSTWQSLKLPEGKPDFRIGVGHDFTINVYRKMFLGQKVKMEWHYWQGSLIMVRLRYQFLDPDLEADLFKRLFDKLELGFVAESSQELYFTDPSGVRFFTDSGYSENFLIFLPDQITTYKLTDYLQKTAGF